jgi:hypothetical protein
MIKRLLVFLILALCEIPTQLGHVKTDVVMNSTLATIRGVTRSISNGNTFTTVNRSATTITNFVRTTALQRITVVCGDANTILQNGSSIIMATGNSLACSLDRVFDFEDDPAQSAWVQAERVADNKIATWIARQDVDADIHPKEPSPWYEVTRFGGYIGPNYRNPATTCSLRASSKSATCASASDFANGHGILVLGAGPAPVIATPQAPMVKVYFQTGFTSLSYCVADRDYAGGMTPCSHPGMVSNAPSSLAIATYTISGESFSNGTLTYTTSTPHNMPTTSSGIASEPWAQVNLTGPSNACNGVFSLVNVPSTKTFQVYRGELISDPKCTSGTVQVQPRIILKWDSRYTYSVQSASCSDGAAKVTVKPNLYYTNSGTAAPNWVVPYFVSARFSDIRDTHYNGTFAIRNYTPPGTAPTSVQFGLNCSGVTNVGAGGTMQLVPGRAVKNHLIYICSAGPSNCDLPANSANYTLQGVATGNDGFFVDKGWGAGGAFIDLGDVPVHAPTIATNEYLDTTITNGGGTTSLTLADAATNGVISAKTFHDNVPNILAACAAIPQKGNQITSGHILIPAPTLPTMYFPVNANLDMYGMFGQIGTSPHNCGGGVLEVRAPIWAGNTILPGKGTPIIGGPGSTNCFVGFWGAERDTACIQGLAYPLLMLQPEVSSSNYFENLEIQPNGFYQSGVYIDEQLNGDGVVDLKFESVHVDGGNRSYPVVDKTGFGRIWNRGGWSASDGKANFTEARTYNITFNCGAPALQPQTPPPFTYIGRVIDSYNFGTFSVDACGLSNSDWGWTFEHMLTENSPGPLFKFNTHGRRLNGAVFRDIQDADPISGAATPLFDATNAPLNGAWFEQIGCATGNQPVVAVNPTVANFGFVFRKNSGVCSAGSGVADVPIGFDNGMASNLLNRGIVNGLGDQAFSATPGAGSCPTAASIGATCTTGAITLPVSYSDTNYRVSCTGQGPTNVPIVETYTKSNTSFTITIASLTAAAANFSSYDCRVGHN